MLPAEVILFNIVVSLPCTDGNNIQQNRTAIATAAEAFALHLPRAAFPKICLCVLMIHADIALQ